MNDSTSSEVNDFDLDRSTAQAWSDFALRLSDVIAHIEPGETLTIGSIATEQEGQSPFVSFACARDRTICAEAAANEVLSEEFQLNTEQLVLLDEMGWQPPNVDGPHPSPNYWRIAEQDDSGDIAEWAAQVLRDVYHVPHPAFLAPDQLAEILTPPGRREAPATTFDRDHLRAIVQTGKTQLDQLVRDQLTDILGFPPMQDEEGDFALRVGSAMVFVRVTGDAQELLVFSALVHEVEGRSRAMEVLSDLNTEARFVRFMLIRDRVFVSLSIFAQPFVAAHLRQALKTVSVVADEIDDYLASKLRGRTTFQDEA